MNKSNFSSKQPAGVRSILASILALSAVVAVVAGTAITVQAQWSGALGSSWNNPASASISRMIIDRMNQRMLEKRLAAKKGAGAPANPATPERPSPPTAEITAVRFKSTGTRIKVTSIARELGGTSAEQAQMRAMLNGLLDTWDQEAAKKGMKNDLALAFAGFISMSASTYREIDLPSDEKVLELRNMIAEALVSGGGMKNVADRQKQEMYEVLAIFGTLAYSGWNQAKQAGDSASAAIYKQLAQKNLETVLGVDADKITFDENGLVLEGGAEAPPSAPADPAAGGTDAVPGGAIPAGQLVADYEGNEVGANLRYGGKRITIYGSVNSIEVEKDGRVSLTFRSSINSYGNAKCYFNKSQSTALARFKSNDQATVTGTVKGYGGGWDGAKVYVILENCVVQ